MAEHRFSYQREMVAKDIVIVDAFIFQNYLRDRGKKLPDIEKCFEKHQI